MIERHPEGTERVPFPHKIFHWKDGSPSLSIELDPKLRGNPPKIEGWEPFFVGFYGYDKPMTYSYRKETPA